MPSNSDGDREGDLDDGDLEGDLERCLVCLDGEHDLSLEQRLFETELDSDCFGLFFEQSSCATYQGVRNKAERRRNIVG
jgi:hypothetical protein